MGISVWSGSVLDVQRTLRKDFSAVQLWVRENKLTLNALKTEFILIASKFSLKEIKETCCMDLQRKTIYRAQETKSLDFLLIKILIGGTY